MQVPDSVVSDTVVLTGEAQRLPDVPCRLVYFQAGKANTIDVAIGGSTVASESNGIVLAASEMTPTMLVDNLNRLYVYGEDGENLNYLVIR